MPETKRIPINELCPSCGWDETFIVEEYEFNEETEEWDFDYDFKTCPKCDWNWDDSGEFPIQAMM